MQHQMISCQVCGHPKLESVLDLGYQPLCNDFMPATEANRPQAFYPLGLCYCSQCSLVQLEYIIPTEYTFGNQYTYLTGSSSTLIEYYSQLASTLVSKYGLVPGDVVVEIGSNDGTFLKAFQSLGLQVLGIEGSDQPLAVAREGGIPTLPRFFGRGIASLIKERLPKGGGIRLITAMNVLAHTDNINEFLPEVAALMGPETIFVSQSHWLVALVRQFEFDTVYHEHLRYYTLGSLMQLFKRHGLSVTDAETTDFYGGSILVHAAIGSDHQLSRSSPVLQEEQELDMLQSLKEMKRVLLSNKAQLINLLVELKMSGKRVVGIGAPMKASTLLNFYGITPDLVEYITEVNQLKVGTLIPGVRIPVINEEIIFKDQPDYAILLSWNMAETIMARNRSLGYTGKFILPVPKVDVIE